MIPLPADHSAEVLLLRKTPYQEDAVILNGISPELGQMSFLARLPSRSGRSKGGFLDLFQVAQVDYRKSERGIFYLKSASVIDDYTGVAASRNGFEGACWLARFALGNILPQMAMPQFFQAMQVALVRLQAENPPPDAVLTGAGLLFLNESGLLSPQEMTPREAAQCQLLLQMAMGGDIPALEAQVWSALWRWIQDRLLDAECKTG